MNAFTRTTTAFIPALVLAALFLSPGPRPTQAGTEGPPSPAKSEEAISNTLPDAVVGGVDEDILILGEATFHVTPQTRFSIASRAAKHLGKRLVRRWRDLRPGDRVAVEYVQHSMDEQHPFRFEAKVLTRITLIRPAQP
ncbi:hypothetical protein G3N55_05830 [Dissulfurirhabdus thermomarina]|uniref:Uncharacterized protein n=1 Tax=Dissulfurirhabdus thermomarina TaxID=1765737 RepID=A0A6N9TM53_DISTH|nr:hypothetical protein [Dissulfurirhabdus thermomarina]NDY42361.1 hypothetical protein [Dissulfurirhabdus thermomarina]NMX23011.1 hypothetical protein [Dissulfurirhabdus thermomarina]